MINKTKKSEEKKIKTVDKSLEKENKIKNKTGNSNEQNKEKTNKEKTHRIIKIISISISLLVVICIIAFFLMNQGFKIGNQNDLENSNKQEIVCKEHKDTNKDRSCDICTQELSDMYYVEFNSLETKINKQAIKLVGNMPKQATLKAEEVEKELYTQKAKEYFKEDFIGVDYAYDLKILSKDEVYNPSEYNQEITVNLKDLKLDSQKHYAVLHIKDEENMEVLNLDLNNGLNKEWTSFKTTSFSVFLVIQVAGKKVSFDSEHIKIYDLNMNELTEGTTVASGTNFEFIAVADEGYGISATNPSGVTSTGSLTNRKYKIASVTKDMTITLQTTTAPVITVQPKSLKTKQKIVPTLEITAENATSYEWQLRRNHDGYWENAQGSGTNSRTFKPKVDNIGVFEYRCLVGNAAYTTDERTVSDTVMVVVASDLNVTYDIPIILNQEIVKQKVKLGKESAQYIVTAQGTNLTFKWQYTTKLDNWWQDVTNSIATVKNVNVSTAQNGEKIMTSTLTTVANQQILQFAEFRCIVGNDNYKAENGAYSDDFLYLAVADDVETKVAYHNIQITKQPESKKVMIGDTAVFSIETEAANTYKWQYKTNYDEKLWTDVDSKMGLAVDVASGFKTAELKIDTCAMNVNVVDGNIEVENNLNGYVFRCVTSSSAVPNATKESDTVLLTVAQDETMYQKIKMLESPKIEVASPIVVGVGKTKKVEVGYNGDGELSVSSSNEDVVIASVTEKTLAVTGVGVGTAKLTLKASAGTNLNSIQAEIDVEVIDEGKMLITEWTIPVDKDGVGQGTTIVLPIPSHANNSYTVDWGDGSEIQTFDSTADFPTHNYKNTEEETYQINIVGIVNQFGYTETFQVASSGTYQNYYTFTSYLSGLISWGEVGATRYGFANCTKLTETIPMPEENSLKNVTSMENVFYGCTNLGGNIHADLFKTCQKVNSFKNAFNGCQTLVGTIPEDLFVNCTDATSFEGIFANCKSLRGNLPANLFASNANVTTFANAFENCITLSGAIPEDIFANNPNVISFASTFKGCSNLEEAIPQNLFVKNQVVEDMSNTFNGCNKLSGMVPARLFTLKDKVTNLSGVFEGCSGLTAAEIQISTENVTNMDNMFKNCTGLESVVFGKNFANLNGAEMFTNCSGLRAVILLSQPLNESDVGTLSDLTTLGYTSGGVIYVPYKENEAVYEKVCTNIAANKIEKLIKANEPNPDYIGLNETYIDKTGYTVAGFDIDEKDKYLQYGFYVVTEGEDVDTSSPGSEWIKYILFKD